MLDPFLVELEDFLSNPLDSQQLTRAVKAHRFYLVWAKTGRIQDKKVFFKWFVKI